MDLKLSCCLKKRWIMSEELEKMMQELTVDEIVQKYSLDDMLAELEEYAECAGFADYYNRVLSKLSEEEVIASFKAMLKSYQEER